MIRLRDATTLALTKLRTRKVRLIITIVISGLLFSGLAGASIVTRGVMGSINDFGKEGLGDRYIAAATSQSTGTAMNDPAVIDRALAIQKDIVARKKVEAKRLGLTYDGATDPSPVSEFDVPGGGKQRYLMPQHPAATQALAEYLAAHPRPGEPELLRILEKYDVKNHYRSKPLPFDLGGAQLQVLKDGKEDFGQQSLNKGGPPTGTDSFVSSWTAMSGDLLKPFILPGQNVATGADGSIPIIVPFSAAEQLLGLKALPNSTPAQERLVRTKEVRAKAPTITFGVCYRNSTSTELVSQAISTQQELEKNKSKKDYQKPELIYGLPTEACGAVPVTRDVRSKDAKATAEKQRQFDEIFGAAPAEQTKLLFRIVGIVPDPDYSNAAGVGQIIRSLVSSSLGSGWYSPIEQLPQNPLLTKLFEGQNIAFGSYESFYAEFHTAAAARKFIDTENCKPDFASFNGPGSEDPFAVCAAEGKPFTTSTFGSNSLALESAKRGFGKFFRLIALGVALVACIIMMGTVGRMIADSRRETAVFRAIGAKKLDISQIYLVYTVFLSALVSVFAIVVGFGLALFAQSRWSEEATFQAIVAYNAQDLDKVFNLYGFYWPDMLYLIGLALLAGVLSALLPLFRNLRRNPIRDMRDDT